jgi:hypothetical protein
VQQVQALKPAAVRAYAQQYFSVERMVQDYLALYREMIEEAGLVKDSGGFEEQAAA